MFVDADDWLSEDTLEKCSTYLKEYDIIRFSAYAYILTELGNINWADHPIERHNLQKDHCGMLGRSVQK